MRAVGPHRGWLPLQVFQKGYQVVLPAKGCTRDEDRMFIARKLDEFLGRAEWDADNRAAFIQSCAVAEACPPHHFPRLPGAGLQKSSRAPPLAKWNDPELECLDELNV